MDRFARLEAARQKRLTKAKGDWVVLKVNDNGKAYAWRKGLPELEAAKLAGYQRDQMSDADVGKGWNYIARKGRKADRNSPTPLAPGVNLRKRSVPR